MAATNTKDGSSATNTKDGSFASDLSALLQSGEGADVTLVVGASQLPAHSSILAARSPVFAAMFRNNMKEALSRRIEISDVQENVLQQLLCFMYTDTAPQLGSMAAELLAAADKYDVPLLKKKCEQKMAQGLSVQSAAATALLALLHSCPGLTTAAVDFIATHPDVMISDSWINVMRSNAEAAAQICSLVAAATSKIRASAASVKQVPPVQQPSSVQQVSPVQQTQDVAAKLTEAAKDGQVEELQGLLASGAPVDARDGSGSTTLHLAVMSDKPDAVKCLLNAGAGVNEKDSSQQTPLHVAASRGVLRVLWVLLTAPVELNARDRWGKTPLHWAAASKKVEAARMLLLAGAAENVLDNNGFYPLHVATSFTKPLFKTLESLRRVYTRPITYVD